MRDARTGEGRTRSGKSPRLLRRALLVCALAAAGIVGAVALAFAAPGQKGAAQAGGGVQATAPQEMTYLCARKDGGVLRYATSSGACSAKEVPITLSDDEPLYACASESGKKVRRVAGLRRCSSTETGLTLRGEGEAFFCAAKKDGRLRYVEEAGECGRKETAVFVPPANRAPVADADSYTVDEDGTLNISAPGVLDGDTDAEGDALTTELVDDAENGALTFGPDGSFGYEPDADFNGTDTFTYRANDGKKDGNTATVTITVNPVNDQPQAEDDTKSTPENTPLVFPASDLTNNDSEGAANESAQNLTVTEVKNAQRGAVVLNSGEITFTPAQDYNGPGSFEYTVCDDGTPQLCSTQTATVNVAVSPVNSKPEATDGTETMNEDDDPITIDFGALVSDTETSNANLTYTIVDGPSAQQGSLTGDGSTRQFDSADDFNGEVVISYKVTDRGDPDGCDAQNPPAQGCAAPRTSDEKTVTITVNPTNDTPVAEDDDATTDEDTATNPPINVLSNDAGLGDKPITVTIRTDGAKGAATVNSDNTITYTPDADENGPDSFVYEVCDGDATPECDTATVNVEIASADDTPGANGDGSGANPAATTDEDTATGEIDVLSNDTGLGDEPITVTIETDGAKGAATVNPDNTITYTPDADENGPDSFVYEVCDGDNDCDTATVFVEVDAANDAPVVDLNGSEDGTGSTAEFLEAEGPDGGNPVTLAPNVAVTDVDDGELVSAKVKLTNRPDGDDKESLDADVGVNGITGITKSYEPSTGELTLSGAATKDEYRQVLATVAYDNTAAPPTRENRAVEFTVNDGDTDSAIATATVTVTPLNEPPVVDLNGSSNGIDSTASFTEDGGPVALAPNAEVTDADDTELKSATVTIRNLQDGDDESLDVNVGTTGITKNYNSSTGVLTLTGPATTDQFQEVLRTTTYANSSDTPGTTAREVEFTVNDDQDDSEAATSTVSVAAANDAPENTVPGAQTLDEDGTRILSSDDGNALSVSDPDAGSNDLQVELSADHARLTLGTTDGLDFTRGSGADDAAMTFTGTVAEINAALNGLIYAPADDYNGSDTLTIATNDQGNSGGGAKSDTDTVAFTVNAVNDAPELSVPASIPVDEDVQTALTGISASDVDAETGAVTLELSVGSGTLAATDGGGVTVSGSGSGTLTLTGSVSNINAFIAASNVEFTTAQDAADDVTLTVNVDDGGNTGSDPGNTGTASSEADSETITVDVQPVNDTPVNTVPAGTFEGATGSDVAITGISTSDVDAGNGEVKVTLSVTGGANNGALTLPTDVTGGLAAADITGNGSASVTATGTLAEINATLSAENGLVYKNTTEGAFTLTVKTDDQGNTGSGGAKTDADAVGIVIDAPPSVTTTNPSDGATDAAPTGNITVNFSEPVNAGVGAFELKCPSTDAARSVVVTGNGTNSITLNPNDDLPGATNCAVLVKANGISDTDANDPPDNMAADHAFTFETAARAFDDAYPQTVTGNVGVNSANIPYSVTTNDQTKPATEVTFVGWNNDAGRTENGGTVSITTSGADRGKFTYNPPPGFEGNDRFTYTLSGGSSATITVPVSGMIWFVNENATTGGDGRLSNPFDTLGAFQAVNNGGNNPNFPAANDNPAAGDNVFLYESATNYAGGVTLLNNQKLIGQEATDSLAAITGLTPRPSGSEPFPTMSPASPAEPVITNGSGVGVTLAQGNTIRGLTVGNTSGSGIKGANLGNATTTMGSDVAVSGTNGGAAVDISGGNGTVNYNGTISNTSGRPVSVTGRTGGTVTFAGDISSTVNSNGILVQDNNTGTNTISFSGASKTLNTGSNPAVTLSNNAGATIGFTNGNLDIDTTSGIGFSATGGGTINVTGTNNTINATSGKAVDIDGGTSNATSTLNMSFANVSSNNSGTDGIRLDDVSGTFTASGGTIAGALSQAIDVSGNNDADTANITYGGTINDGSGSAVSVANQNGGTKDFNGAITDGNGGGISLANNTNATIRFDGGLTLSTGAASAFSATGGGTVAVTDANGAGIAPDNTVTTTTGTALNVANTTIGSDGLNFKSISANGATNAIVLNNTGTSGGLTVTGGGNTSQGGDNSGGTIQNTTGIADTTLAPDGATSGILLTNTRSPSFNNMNIQNTDDSGIFGTQVTNFSFTNGTINSAGNGSDEGSISLDSNIAAGSVNVSGTVTITNNKLTASDASGVDIQNISGTLDHVTISNNMLSGDGLGPVPGSAGKVIGLSAAANITRITVTNNTISSFNEVGFVLQANGGNIGIPGHATNKVLVTGNAMDGTNAPGGIGNQADSLVVANVGGGGPTSGGQGNFDISNNGTSAAPIKNIDGIVISITADGVSNATATINNNFIRANNAVGSAGIAPGADFTATLTATVTNNNVGMTDGQGIFSNIRNGATARLNISNNIVAAPTPTSAARAGIQVSSGSDGDSDANVCMDMFGNTTAGSTNSGTGTTAPGITLRKDSQDGNQDVFGVEGMAATSSPGVEQYVGNAPGGKNPLSANGTGNFGTNGVALLSATTGFSSCSTAP